jgi:hypothetical protein
MLVQYMSLRFEESKSFGWSRFCGVLVPDIHCIITEVNEHVMKGHGMAGLNADPLVENSQWSLGNCHHSPLKVLKKNSVGYEQEEKGRIGGVHVGTSVGRYAFPSLPLPPLLSSSTMLCSSNYKI